MRKAIVVLHFGAHKTGTSLLQKFMRDRPNEITQSGIYAISRSETSELLGWGNNFLKNPTNLINRIDSIYSKGFKYIVISHENALGRPFVEGGEFLYPRASSLIDNYRHHLSKYDVRFIFYIRDTADFVESYYIQTIQQGSCRSFRKWFASFGGCENLSWSPLVQSIKLVNFNSLEIINFSNAIKNGQEQFISQFFSAFLDNGDRHPNVKYSSKRNLSVGALGLELLKSCNLHVSKPEERKLLRKFFQANFNNSIYDKPKLLSDSQKIDIFDKYDKEFSELTAIYNS